MRLIYSKNLNNHAFVDDGKGKWYSERRHSVVDVTKPPSSPISPTPKRRHSLVAAMFAKKEDDTLCKALIIYFHGGGFIAMSSFSHEMYTRKWAVDTGVCFFCVCRHYTSSLLLHHNGPFTTLDFWTTNTKFGRVASHI